MDINDRDISGISNQAENSATESPISTTDLLQMIVSLKQQVEKQKEELDSLSDRIRKSDDKMKLLVSELVNAQYIKIGERRKPLQRNITSVESLINILLRKHMITRKEFLAEVKKFRKTESPQ